jgi:UDP-hydrolysing UDP-N-acetyl-D-glucosamine 2-epimerase
MKKVSAVITARASYSRIKSVLIELNKSDDLILEIVIMASALVDKYGSIINYLENDGLNISYKIFSLVNTQDSSFQSKTTGLGIIELSNYFSNFRPHIVITIADRFETISTAISASYMNIPLIHFQGGEDSGNIDNKVRNAITHLSDYHFVSNEKALERLISMGISESKVFNFGCPSIDIIDKALEQKISSSIFERYSWSGKKIDLEKSYIVVLQHAVTDEPDTAHQIQQTINAIKKFNNQVIWFWPNIDYGTDKISKVLRVFSNNNSELPICFIKSLGPNDFLRLISKCSVLIGNSSVGIRESSYIGVPVVNIGTRQKNRTRAENVLDVNYDSKEILEAISTQFQKKLEKSTIYGKGNAAALISKKIETIIGC